MNGLKPIYIFHWDTDGIASTTLLKKYVDPAPKLYTPHIGLYTLRYVNRRVCKDIDWITIIDLGVSNDEIKNLMKKCGLKAIVIDHHFREFDDDLDIVDFKMDNELYPSTTILVSDKLKIKYNLLSILGLVGDLGAKIYYSKYLSLVEEISSKYGLSVDDVIKLSLLIDSNYISMNRRNVVRAVDILLKYSERPKKLLNYSLWIRQYKEAMAEVNRVLSIKPRDIDGLKVLEFQSRFFITSMVGRELSMRYKNTYIIIGRPSLYKGFSQIYVRIYPKPGKTFFQSIIRELSDRGYLAGGKEDVFGVIFPSSKYKELLQWIINKLRGVDHG